MGWSWDIAVALACVQIALGLGVRAKVEDPQPVYNNRSSYDFLRVEVRL